jgi:hypothetical protein
MSKHILHQKTRLISVLALLILASSAAEAAFVDKIKLIPSDAKPSVSKALKQIPRSDLTLVRIAGIHQGTSRNLKGEEEFMDNTATIYAVISGTGSSGAGQPLEFNKDVELISCDQLHNKRWICRFSIFNAAIFPIASRYFFLEK